jgi:hypothetical protein
MYLAKVTRKHQHQLTIEVLLLLCKQDQKKSSQMLPSELVLLNDKHWSARTVHRRLVNMGYKSYKANENHYENRLSTEDSSNSSDSGLLSS